MQKKKIQWAPGYSGTPLPRTAVLWRCYISARKSWTAGQRTETSCIAFASDLTPMLDHQRTNSTDIIMFGHTL